MPAALQSLCPVLLMLYVESVLSVCEVSVRTVNFGCHLDWQCPDATPSTTFTVQNKVNGTWKNVSHCSQISRHTCDLSNVLTNIHVLNYIRLRSEGLQDWISKTQYCDPISDVNATFSPPSIEISMENGSIWVTVNFPCAPSISCRFKEEEGEEECEEEDEEEDEDEKKVEMLCPCPLYEITSLSVTVMLYNKHKPSDIQIRSAQVMDKRPFREEFGFVISGQVYCALANFTSKSPQDQASPPSPPQCISIPAKIESFVIVVVCVVLIILGLVSLLLWRQCSSPEPPLPKSLALLYDQEIQIRTFTDSSKTASDHQCSEGDRISIVSLTDFTHMDNQSYYHSSQSLGNGYYRSPVLNDPDCTEESSGGLPLESEGLETDGTHRFELQTTHLILERGDRCPYLDECDGILHIPLSSVQVKCSEQEETTTNDPKQYLK